MNFNNRTPHEEMFRDYLLLKNHGVNREYCFTEEGQLVKILLSKEIRAKYAKVYEGKTLGDINRKYIDAEQIVKSMREHIIILSTRIDDIILGLTYTSNIAGIHLIKRNLELNEITSTNIYTKADLDGKISSHIVERISIDQVGKTISEETKIIKKQLGFKFETHDQEWILK